MVLSQELHTSKETNVEKVVKLVVSLLDDSKASAMSFTEANQNEISTNCDICDFKCENEKLLITHMRQVRSMKNIMPVTSVENTLAPNVH